MADSDGRENGFQKVCETSDVPEDGGHVVVVDDQEIAVFEVDGSYYAISNVCPHQGGPLGEGVSRDTTVHCPWHGYEFDLETGKHVQNFDDDLRAPTYDVTVEDDDVLVRVP